MITLKNPNTNLIRECPTGYSWTTCFFNLFVPLVRGDIKWAAINAALCLLICVVTFNVGALLVGPIFAAFYNKLYIKDQLEKGFVPADEDSRQWLVQNGIIARRTLN